MHLTKLQVVLAEVAMLYIQSNYLQEARPSKYTGWLQGGPQKPVINGVMGLL